MSVNLSPVAGAAAQFFDNSGNVLTGGKLFTYLAGTTTPAATYTSSVGITFHANPIILDAAGRVPNGGEIWLADNISYKFVLKDANDVLIATWDNLSGINSNFVNYAIQEEVQTATAGQTVFTLTTTTYAPGTNSLSVFVDGVNQYEGSIYSFIETNTTTVTFTAGLHVGALVKFTTAVPATGNATSANVVTFTGFKSQSGVVQDLADDDGSDWIGFEPAGTGAVARSVQTKLRETVSVKDFGAVGDGVADDTAAIQAALNTGKLVFLPSGTYRTTSTINITVDSTGLYGEGLSSVIEPDFISGDVFLVGDGATEIWGLSFSDFLVWPSVVKTSGYVFNNRIALNCKWNHVYLGCLDRYATHRLYDGYYFDRFGECLIFGGQIIVSETAVKARGNADNSIGFELNLTGDLRILFATKGVWIGGACGGIYLDRLDTSECVNGLYFDSTLQSGVPNREIFLSPGCTIDASGEWGIVFKAASASLVQATGLWVASSGQTSATSGGILVEASAGGSYSWSNLMCFNNAYDGVSIADGSHSFSGGFIRNNGRGVSGGNGVTTTGFSRLIISGATLHANGSVARGYGLSLHVAANNYLVESNSFFGNLQGNVFSTNATLTQITRDNFGYVTENSGYAQILAGNNTVVVNHGLDGIPTLVEVGFASPQDPPDVYVYSAPSSFTSTQFTIVYSNTATINRDFWWRATRGKA